SLPPSSAPLPLASNQGPALDASIALQSPRACTCSTWAPLRLRPPTSPDRRTPPGSARSTMRPLASVAEAAVRLACALAAVPASARGGGGGGSRVALGAPAQPAS